MSDFLKLLYRRALGDRDPALLQVSFETSVLDRYRVGSSFSVIRTNTVGRVKREGGWTLDVGIAPDEASVHAGWGDLANRLPDSEHEHWAAHAVASAAYSEMFLRMRLSPGSCFDDGELRPWQ